MICRMGALRWAILLWVSLVTLSLSACNGGGVGNTVTTSSAGSEGSSATASPTATATPTPSPTLRAIQVTPAEENLPISFTVQMHATAVYTDGSTRDLTNQVTWTSASPAVASVSASGVASGRAAGTAIVTAASGGVQGQATLTVTAAVLQGIEVRPPNPTLAIGSTLQMTALGLFSDNTDLDVSSQVTWSSSAAAVASVSSSGLLTGKTAGTAQVIATLGGVHGATTATVTASALARIDVTPATPAIPVGGAVDLTATGVYADGSQVNLTAQATWSSTASGVASVSSQGRVTGVAAGRATIAALVNGIQGTAQVTVSSAGPLAISPASASVIDGGQVQFQVLQGGQPLSGVAWTTSDPSIATIDPSGLATGVKAGAVTVVGTAGGTPISAPLQVTAPTVIPTPPATNAIYFQTMLDNRVDASGPDAHTVHLTYRASTLALNAPAILNACTWLSGGFNAATGKWDDYTKPVMQVANSSKGVVDTSGNVLVSFADTYDVPLAKLPLDPTGQYRVLKIPFLDPNNAQQSNAGSGRLLVTLDQASTISISTDGNGKPNGWIDPSAAPPLVQGGQKVFPPGGAARFDFLEINLATPIPVTTPQTTQHVAVVDTTNVNFFSLGLTMNCRNINADATESVLQAGLNLAVAQPVSDVLKALRALTTDYTQGDITDNNGKFLRYLSPQGCWTSSTTALASLIQAGYNAYQNKTLTFAFKGVTYAATASPAVGNATALNFTQPSVFSIGLPTSLDAASFNGSSAVPGGNFGDTPPWQSQPELGQIMSVYLCRGVFGDTSLWPDPTTWYPGTGSNLYMAVLHGKNVNQPAIFNFFNGLIYAHTFDDSNVDHVPPVPNQDDTQSTTTSLTLVINNQ